MDSSGMDHQGRQQRLRSALALHHLDALLVTHLPNVLYLCGFRGSAGALLLTGAKSMFFTDVRYTSQARSEVQGARIVIARKAPLAAAADWLAAHAKKKAGRPASSPTAQFRLGFDAERMPVASRNRLAASLPSHIRLREALNLVERARMVKDAQEIERIRAAVLMGAGLFERALAAIRPGVTEAQVAAEMEYAARQAGAEGMSFPTIVASGDRSSLPHGRASRSTISARGFVVCDFGVILTDYCSDMTRTVYVGRPSSEERRAYQAVKEAQQAAVEAVKTGTSVGEIDRAARTSLQRSG
jgi:Xaa-Pro aminopeptidase